MALPSTGLYSISPEPSTSQDRIATYDVKTGQYEQYFILVQTNPRTPTVDKPLNVELKWPEAFNYRMSYLHHVVAFSSDSYLALDYSPGSTPFSVKRTLTGSSQAFGRLSVVITNHRTEAINVLYLETMPWLLQFYLHTLEARIDGVVERMSTFSVIVAGALQLIADSCFFSLS